MRLSKDPELARWQVEHERQRQQQRERAWAEACADVARRDQAGMPTGTAPPEPPPPPEPTPLQVWLRRIGGWPLRE